MDTNSSITDTVWVFSGGAILVLLQSIVSETKRNWWRLLVGCFFGGIGSLVASQIWMDSKFIYIICGVAAVVTENLLAGVVNASKEFSQSPVRVFTHFFKMVMPTFGKTPGEGSSDLGDIK